MATPTTALRRTEEYLEKFKDTPFSFGLPEAGRGYLDVMNPCFYANKMARVATNACVDAAVRTATLPWAVCDLAHGVLSQDQQKIKDGLMAFPKTVVHVIGDVACIAAVTAAVGVPLGLFAGMRLAVNEGLDRLGAYVIDQIAPGARREL